MIDLTQQVFPDGPVAALVPTSQAGGNRWSRSDRSAALTAPGSETTAGAVPEAEQPGPFASATEVHQPGHIISGEVLPENRGRPSIRMGEWNSL